MTGSPLGRLGETRTESPLTNGVDRSFGAPTGSGSSGRLAYWTSSTVLDDTTIGVSGGNDLNNLGSIAWEDGTLQDSHSILGCPGYAISCASNTGITLQTSGTGDVLVTTGSTGDITLNTGTNGLITLNPGSSGNIVFSDLLGGFLRTTAGGVVQRIKDNLTAAVDPTMNEDSGDGYADGSMWINATANKVFFAADVAVGAAVWKEVGGGGGGNSFTTIDCPLGTDPVADSATDTLVLGSSAGLNITGDSATDSILFELNWPGLTGVGGLADADLLAVYIDASSAHRRVTFLNLQSSLTHAGIGGLTADDHTQYALLAGRATGQVLIGGTASGDDLELESTSHATKGHIRSRSNFIIGNDAADIDYTLTFAGETNDGVVTWMEDEDYLKFSDHNLMDADKAFYFRETTNRLYSPATGEAVLEADTILYLGKEGDITLGVGSASGEWNIKAGTDNKYHLGISTQAWMDIALHRKINWYSAATVLGGYIDHDESNLIIEPAVGKVRIDGIDIGGSSTTTTITANTVGGANQSLTLTSVGTSNLILQGGSSGRVDTTTFNLTTNQIGLDDSGADHHLFIDIGENLTADRILTLTVTDAARTLALGGNLTVEAASLINQDLTTDSTVATFGTFTTTNTATLGKITAGNETATLASDVLTITRSFIYVNAESGSADTLKGIVITGHADGTAIWITANAADSISVTHNDAGVTDGRIILSDATSRTLTDTKIIHLVLKAPHWYEPGAP